VKINPDKIDRLIGEIDGIIQKCRAWQIEYAYLMDRAHPDLALSTRNLIHYLALRSRDLRDLQRRLGNLGMSRLAKSEAHVMSSLIASRRILHALKGGDNKESQIALVTFKKSKKLLRSRCTELFGYKSQRRRVRIMVTLPSEAADDPTIALQLMKAGMNSARINCVHDGPEQWERMIANVRKAARRVGRTCKISMDLGGPKIRTGSMIPGPKVVHLQPERDLLGRITGPARVGLVPEGLPIPAEAEVFLPLPSNWLSNLSPGQHLKFRDTRGKERSLKIGERELHYIWAYAFDSCYLQTGMELRRQDDERSVAIGEIMPQEQVILLKPGDLLRLHADPRPGEPALYDAEGNLIVMAHISCTSSEVFHHVRTGEAVFFDDGKIEGLAEHVGPEEMRIRIVNARESGSKLRADKGINFPKSDLRLSGLTAKDREDLEFVVAHADAVSMSFVNSARDVQDLIDALAGLGARDRVGIIIKIETQTAFNNLADILLTAMQTKPVGIMIARGDLAIECGWENIGRIQEEILWMCEAAHIPTIWATQVLENMAKKGIPSRAEITDAVMAQRADCVMLNKGPFIADAIRMLDSILQNMEGYQIKKEALLPVLEQNLSEKRNEA
jgi:pyruvate kinase